MSEIQRIDGMNFSKIGIRGQEKNREHMTESQRVDYVLRAMKKNRLRRAWSETISEGGDPEKLQDIAQKRKELEMEEIASSIAHLRFPRSVFDRWCAEQPPRAAETPEPLIWTCETCGVTVMPSVVADGYIRGNCQCQRKQTDGRLQKEAIERAEALRREQMINLFKKTGRYSWLAPQHNLEMSTFENFDLNRVERKDRQDVAFALKFAQHFVQRPTGNVIAYGPHGSGKTHIFSAMLNAWCEDEKRTGLYANAMDLFAVIDNLRSSDGDLMDIENKMKWCDLLVIDEIDRVKLTDGRFGFYHRVLNYRSQKEMEKPGSAPTILICNATINADNAANDLESYIGTPAASRIQPGLTPVFVPGNKDQRVR